MGKLIDFKLQRSRKQIKMWAGNRGVLYEIYLSVLLYINCSLENKYSAPIDHLNTETGLKKEFRGNEELFFYTIQELIAYWDLEPSMITEDMKKDLFLHFEKVGDLCFFIQEHQSHTNS
ncbi:hypothetical protein N781_03810 [Pontibacillus halophilus JSM 076056 = DSM 19796]|uniref:Uncharacterized protein n=1 Tax=Pontibacillus halophilus JSM 076056 = DSM 19796 TaxID=1385510 RepID=A0A0A5GI48_9BACI|nr:hypothetical protein [Pontibacillus halophilus]KGX91684.1 hypothetical protein N781_03810 [Pontibacillus halophilus JSM 076056 = DSM 19796]